ncbi:condensation domain-containing protein [Kordia sp.]|uniref:condensation domain-containing protein n=1 Tax=Kordia sp. TaxID=1965332 RepID=UPI0025BE5FCB|nr:condensation domain-containing protein [Kordia sp.]MCH2195470.1 condensation domain-containing protein [Kordia sp.]
MDEFCTVTAFNFNKETLVEISENQKHMMNFPESQAVIGPFVLPQDVDEILGQEVQQFLSYFPELHIEFIEKDGKIYQKKSTDNTIQIETIYKEANITNEVLETWQEEIALQKFDIINGVSTRLQILKDSISDRTWFCLAMSHVLIDLHSAQILHDVLRDYIFKRTLTKQETMYSSLHFATWQQHFLESETGKASRAFWKSFLVENLQHNTLTEKLKQTSYIAETYTIIGDEFTTLQNYANHIKVSLSVVCMAYHEYVMEQLKDEAISIQLMLVNGRERSSESFDASNVIGVINNMLPLPITQKETISFEERCTALQLKYIQARQHQNIPFETIRKDFIQESAVDIASVRQGTVNFQPLGGEFDIQPNPNTVAKNININRKIYLDMTCRQRTNGIQIEFISTPELSEKLGKANLSPKNILKFLPINKG